MDAKSNPTPMIEEPSVFVGQRMSNQFRNGGLNVIDRDDALHVGTVRQEFRLNTNGQVFQTGTLEEKQAAIYDQIGIQYDRALGAFERLQRSRGVSGNMWVISNLNADGLTLGGATNQQYMNVTVNPRRALNDLLGHLRRISNSWIAVRAGENIVFTIKMAINPAGAGYDKHGHQKRTTERIKSGNVGVVAIPDRGDKMCMLRAIIAGRHHKEMTSGQWKDYKKRNVNDIKKRAQKNKFTGGRYTRNRDGMYDETMDLALRARLPIRRALQPLETQKIVDYAEEYKNYRIRVWCISEGGRSPLVFETHYNIERAADYTILDILLEEGHYHYIRTLTAVLESRQVCNECNQGIANRGHRCPKNCPYCAEKECNNKDHIDANLRISCDGCWLKFASRDCLRLHQESKDHPCGTLWYCHECGFPTYHGARRHPGAKRPPCYKNHHKIPEAGAKELAEYIQTQEFRENPDQWGVYDLETYTNDEGEHIANAGVIQYYTPEWELTDTVEIHNNGNCIIKNLGDEMFKPENEGTIFIAHNARGFDHKFVLQYLRKLRLQGIKVEPIEAGLKIQAITVRRTRWGKNQRRWMYKCHDSLLHLKTSLRKMPSKVGLEDPATEKGFFPHRFNQPRHWNYRGKIPGINAFMYNSEEEKSVTEFINENQDREWIFKDELFKYCRQDVYVLAQCIAQHQKNVRAGMDWELFPLTHPTISSYTLNLWRSQFMPKKSVYITPKMKKDSASIISREYLEWESVRRSTRIQHAFNGGEKTLKIWSNKYQKYQHRPVDGWHEESKTPFQFHGCFWHGHDCPSGSQPRYRWEKRRRESQRKDADLKAQFPNTIIMYECQWIQFRERDTLAKNIVRSLMGYIPGTQQRLDMYNQGLQGGRTEVFKHRTTADHDDQAIWSHDVCSMYPFIMLNHLMPSGKPQILFDTEFDPDVHFGMARVVVEAPQHLLIPSLMHNLNGKLMSFVCRKCAEDKKPPPCPHDTAAQRAWCDTYTSVELKYALSLGYKIHKTFEIHHFPPDQCRHDIFTDLMKFWVKEKLQYSGWEGRESPEEKQKYLAGIHEALNVSLDPNILDRGRNEGRRQTAKLIINNIWGKLCQRTNLTKSTITYSQEELSEYFDEDKYMLKNIVPLGMGSAEVWYCFTDQKDDPLSWSNRYIPCFVTAYARTRLNKMFRERGYENICYCDTDSVKDNNPQPYIPSNDTWQEELPPTHQFVCTYDVTKGILGVWENEEKPGVKITKFIAIGPKAYHQLRSDKSVTTKVKGFVHNKEYHETLTTEIMEQLVDGTLPSVSMSSSRIEMRSRDLPLRNIEVVKQFNGCSSDNDGKRFRQKPNKHGEICTLPWGYQNLYRENWRLKPPSVLGKRKKHVQGGNSTKRTRLN